MKDLSVLDLPGLDGQNPLGFFAALGLLRVLDERTPSSRPRPRLAFLDQGRRAELRAALSFDELCGLVLEDAAGRYGSAALALAYDERGQLAEAGGEKVTADLKPPPETATAFLASLSRQDRRSQDLAMAFFAEEVVDNNGNTKPTAFHFTAGQQKFLEMVGDLRTGLQRGHVEEALRGPWRNQDALPSLSWDSTVARQYALRAVNPSSEKRGSVAAANWLAVIGLSFFPVSRRRGRLVTTGVVGGWKDSVFHWPVWSPPCTRLEVAGLLRADVAALGRREREALGITQIFRSAISRSDQGGYGSFSPAEVELPPAKRRPSEG